MISVATDFLVWPPSLCIENQNKRTFFWTGSYLVCFKKKFGQKIFNIAADIWIDIQPATVYQKNILKFIFIKISNSVGDAHVHDLFNELSISF